MEFTTALDLSRELDDLEDEGSPTHTRTSSTTTSSSQRARELEDVRIAAALWASQLEFEASQQAPSQPASAASSWGDHATLTEAQRVYPALRRTVAMVMQLQALRDVPTKSGAIVRMGKVLVGDASAQYVELVMWRDVATRWGGGALRIGSIVELRGGVRWGVFNKKANGTVGSATSLRLLGHVAMTPSEAAFAGACGAELRLRRWARDTLRWKWPRPAAAAAEPRAASSAAASSFATAAAASAAAVLDVREARAHARDQLLSVRAVVANVAVEPPAARGVRARVVLRDARDDGERSPRDVHSSLVLHLWGAWAQPERIARLRARIDGAPVLISRVNLRYDAIRGDLGLHTTATTHVAPCGRLISSLSSKGTGAGGAGAAGFVSAASASSSALPLESLAELSLDAIAAHFARGGGACRTLARISGVAERGQLDNRAFARWVEEEGGPACAWHEAPASTSWRYRCVLLYVRVATQERSAAASSAAAPPVPSPIVIAAPPAAVQQLFCDISPNVLGCGVSHGGAAILDELRSAALLAEALRSDNVGMLDLVLTAPSKKEAEEGAVARLLDFDFLL